MSGDIPRAPNRDDKGKAPQKSNLQLDLDDFSRSKRVRTDDQTEITFPRPNPRTCYLLLGELESGCAVRTLPPSETGSTYPALHIISDYEHLVFLDIPSFIDTTDSSADPLSLSYRVFDKEAREYKLKLSRTSIPGIKVVSLESSDWPKIVSDHKLRAGDKVFFNRYIDTDFSGDFFYTLNYVRSKPLDGENDDARKEAEDNQKVSEPSNVEVGTLSGFNVVYCRILLEKAPDHAHGAGSRYFPPKGYCVKKTLRRGEVIPGEGKLYLTVEDAFILTDNPKIAEVRPREGAVYSKEIVVFDEKNRRYKMTLNHHLFIAQRGFVFCLGGQWIDFVAKHDLKEGDQVMIYKFLDSRFFEGYYHVVRYVNRKPTDVVRIMNDPVGAAEEIPMAVASDQRLNMAVASNQERNIQLALGSDQRRNMAVGSHQRRNFPPRAEIRWIPMMMYGVFDHSGNHLYYMPMGDQIMNLPPFAAVDDPNIPLAADGDQRRNIRLAPIVDPRRNAQLAAGVDQRRNILLAAGGDRRGNISLAAHGDRRSYIRSLRPGSRSLMPSHYCTTKTLDPRDVFGPEPRLHLDALSEAIYLCNDPDSEPSYPLGKDSKTLRVYGQDDNPYEMSLSHHASEGGRITYTLGDEWKNFVQVHGLRASDSITIYKVLDTRIQSEYYYVFRL